MTTTQERFNEQFKRWTYMIEHYGWKLTVIYCGSSEDMPEEFKEDALAGTHHKFKYLDACIYVNERKCKDLDDKEIEYIVIYELTHLLVAPLQESSESTPLEYTVTTLARIMQCLRISEVSDAPIP